MAKAVVAQSKVCRVCCQAKSASDFYSAPRLKDGLNPKCKLCYRAERSAYAKTEGARKLARKRYSRPKTKEYNKAWKQTVKGQACRKRESASPAFKDRMRRYYLKNARSPKLLARGAINNAIRSGKLPSAKALLCACGKQAQHYHHHLGYAREHRLSVIPVCAVCHKAAHSQSKD